jgi:hypothetical protein
MVFDLMKYFALLIFAGIITIQNGCFQLFDPGHAHQIKTSVNPQKTYKAILFLKDGNATGSESYQVSIKAAAATLEDTEAGNTFTVDENRGKTFLKPNSIDFKWITSDTLKIIYDRKLRCFIQNEKVEKVSVVYQKK